MVTYLCSKKLVINIALPAHDFKILVKKSKSESLSRFEV